MFLLLNGSFGIGKTTVAELLARDVAGAAIYNPEAIGFVLRRLPPFFLGLAAQPADYQDLRLWQRLIVRGAKRMHRRAPVTIVPMAFTNPAYLKAFTEALRTDGDIRCFCLVAPLSVVEDRLARRARTQERAVTEFERRRAAECVALHGDPVFGTPIDATRSPAEIAGHIRSAARL